MPCAADAGSRPAPCSKKRNTANERNGGIRMDKRTKAWAAVKIVAFLVLAALLATAIQLAQAETMWVDVAPGSHLNARSKPRTGAIEAKLERGWAVEVVETRQGWAAITGWGECGTCWVDARYLSAEAPKDPTPCKPEKMQTKADKVRLRAYPGGEVLRRLEKGTAVTVTGWVIHEGAAWAQVDGGYIMAEFLEVAQPWQE